MSAGTGSLPPALAEYRLEGHTQPAPPPRAAFTSAESLLFQKIESFGNDIPQSSQCWCDDLIDVAYVQRSLPWAFCLAA